MTPQPKIYVAGHRGMLGWSEQQLRHCLRLAEIFPDDQILSTVRRELTWSHIKSLIYIDDPRYFRPTEVETLLGDPIKVKQKLGWVPEITLDELVQERVATDLADAKKHALLKQYGFNVNVSVE